MLGLSPQNPLTLGFGGSYGNFLGFAENPPQIAPKAETRRRIPMQRRVILCGRYGFICRDFRDRAGKSTASTLSRTCQQRHIRDTSETVQGQKRVAAEHETRMYQCFFVIAATVVPLAPHLFHYAASVICCTMFFRRQSRRIFFLPIRTCLVF